MDPICPTGCLDTVNALPAVKFDDCAPEINPGEIETLYLGVRGVDFTDVNDQAEWVARLAATDETKIIALTVMGDKPLPAANTKDISGGRKIALEKDHVINFTIDETNQTNHDMVRKLECGGNFAVWYKISGGIAMGGENDGNTGIKGFIEAGMLIPRGRGENMTYDGTISWKAKFTEARFIHPLA